MQLTSLLGIGAEAETTLKDSIDIGSGKDTNTDFLAMLMGIMPAMQAPLSNEATNNISAVPVENGEESALLVDENAETGSHAATASLFPLSTDGTDSNGLFDKEAAKAGDAAAILPAVQAPLSNEATNNNISAVPVENGEESASLVDENAETGSQAATASLFPLSIDGTDSDGLFDKAAAKADDAAILDTSDVEEGNLLAMPLPSNDEGGYTPVMPTPSNGGADKEGLSSGIITAGSKADTSLIDINNANTDSTEAIHGFAAIKADVISNDNKSKNKGGDKLLTTNSDRAAITYVANLPDADGLTGQDAVSSNKVFFQSETETSGMKAATNEYLPMSNQDISKPSADANEHEDLSADKNGKSLLKSNLESDNVSGSAFKNRLENTIAAFGEDSGDEGSVIKSFNDVNAAIGSGGAAGNTKEVLISGKGEASAHPVEGKAVETQVVEKTAQGIRIIATDGGGRMKISLYPESLGHIRIDVSVSNDGIVNARMVAENSQVKDVIDNNISRLKDSLLQQGLKIDQFSVSVDQQRQSDFSANERKTFWYKNPEQEAQADYNIMHDQQLTTHVSRIAMGNVDIFV